MRFRRLISALAIVAFLPVSTVACFGKFNMTRKVYQLNQDVSTDKWVRWIAFLILSIVPIYGIATVLDAVIFNSMEFWTGDNPVTTDAGSTRYTYGPDGVVGRSTLRSDGAIDIEITQADGKSHFLTLVREVDGVSALDASGELIASVRDGKIDWAAAH